MREMLSANARTLLLVLLALTGCSANHTREVAFSILFSPDGAADTVAFTGALSAKFPRGTSVEALVTFIKANSGACRERDSGHLWCEVPLREKFCASSLLGIEVTYLSGTIASLVVKPGGVSC